ncbi:MAG: glycosyltransferase [Acidobacteria bacterium]|nr:glycosyltransferase [Acidobacteriota bacterium]
MLWFLIGLATLMALLSLRGESARAAYYRTSLNAQPPAVMPPVTVIVPVKGLEEGLRQNLASLAALHYPDYELLVVARAADDPGLRVAPASARIVIAGDGPPDTGEKIVNLLAGVASARPQSTVFAFADSDGRYPAKWLTALVTALETPGTGASTGYRWHIPESTAVWPLLRSVWNAVIAGGMGPGDNRFCWGGATAIRRETFFRINVPAWWRGAVSDDYRLSEAVHAAGLKVTFTPGALAASTDSTTATEFLSWSRRQMMITRFYAPGLWRLALFAHVVYCSSMIAALYLHSQGYTLAGAALVLQLAIGNFKAIRRLDLARAAMPQYDAWFRSNRLRHTALTVFGTWLWLYACLASGISDTITWRGYRLRLRRMAPPVASPNPSAQ